jgi:GAF domain-containing protein
MGLVSLVDVRGQVWPGAYGVPESWAAERATPLSHSFCKHVVATGRPLLVANARVHSLIARNGAVADLGVVAYAGVPLTLDGTVPGALCAIDHQPRSWTPGQLTDLQELAGVCSELLRRRIPRQDERSEVTSPARPQNQEPPA